MAGCPSADRASTLKKRSRGCVKRHLPRGGTTRRCRSVCLGRRPLRRFSPNTVKIGIDRALLAIPDLTRDEILGVLDKHARLVA